METEPGGRGRGPPTTRRPDDPEGMDRDEDDMPVAAYPLPIYFKGLPPGTSEAALNSLLSSFGTVRFCTIIPGASHSPMAIVRFRAMHEADAALQSLNGRSIQGAHMPLDIRHVEVAYDGTHQPQYEEAGECVDIPQGLVGYVIGKGGETVKSLQARSGASISIDQNFPEALPRRMIMIGARRNVENAKSILLEIFAAAPSAMSEAKDVLAKLSNRYNMQPPAVTSHPRIQRQHYVQQFQQQREQYQREQHMLRKQLHQQPGAAPPPAVPAAASTTARTVPQQPHGGFPVQGVHFYSPQQQQQYQPARVQPLQQQQHQQHNMPAYQPAQAGHQQQPGHAHRTQLHASQAQVSSLPHHLHQNAPQGAISTTNATPDIGEELESINLGEEADLATSKLAEAQAAREDADSKLMWLSEDLPRESVSPAIVDPVVLESWCNTEMQKLCTPVMASVNPDETLQALVQVSCCWCDGKLSDASACLYTSSTRTKSNTNENKALKAVASGKGEQQSEKIQSLLKYFTPMQGNAGSTAIPPSCMSSQMVDASEAVVKGCADFARIEMLGWIHIGNLKEPNDGLKLALSTASALATCANTPTYMNVGTSGGCIGALVEIACAHDASFCTPCKATFREHALVALSNLACRPNCADAMQSYDAPRRLAEMTRNGSVQIPFTMMYHCTLVCNRLEANRAIRALMAASSQLLTMSPDTDQEAIGESIEGSLARLASLIQSPRRWQKLLDTAEYLSPPSLKDHTTNKDGGLIVLLAERNPVQSCVEAIATRAATSTKVHFVRGVYRLVSALSQSPTGISLLATEYSTIGRQLLLTLSAIADTADRCQTDTATAVSIRRTAESAALVIQSSVRAAGAADALLSAESMKSEQFADAALELSTLSSSVSALPAMASALTFPGVIALLLSAVQQGGISEGNSENDATVHSLAAPSAASVLSALALADPLSNPSMWISRAVPLSAAVHRSTLHRPPQSEQIPTSAAEEAAMAGLSPRQEDLDELQGVACAAKTFEQSGISSLVQLLQETIKPVLFSGNRFSSLSPSSIATLLACLRILTAVQPRHHVIPATLGFQWATNYLVPLLSKSAAVFESYDMPIAEGDGSMNTDVACIRFWLRINSMLELAAELLREVVRLSRRNDVAVNSSALVDAALSAHAAVCDSGPASQLPLRTIPEAENSMAICALQIRRLLIDILSPWLQLNWGPNLWNRLQQGSGEHVSAQSECERIATERVRADALLVADLLPPTPPELLNAQNEPEQAENEHQPQISSRREEVEQSLDEHGETLAAITAAGALSSDYSSRQAVCALWNRLCCVSPRHGEQCIKAVLSELDRADNIYDKGKVLLLFVDMAKTPCGIAALRLANTLERLVNIYDELIETISWMHGADYRAAWDVCRKCAISIAARLSDATTAIVGAHSIPQAHALAKALKLALVCVSNSVIGATSACYELLQALSSASVGADAIAKTCSEVEVQDSSIAVGASGCSIDGLENALSNADPSGSLSAMLRDALQASQAEQTSSSSLVAIVMDAVTKADIRMERCMPLNTQPSEWLSQVAEVDIRPPESEREEDLRACTIHEYIDIPEKVARDFDKFLKARKAEAPHRESKFGKAIKLSEAAQAQNKRREDVEVVDAAESVAVETSAAEERAAVAPVGADEEEKEEEGPKPLKLNLGAARGKAQDDEDDEDDEDEQDDDGSEADEQADKEMKLDEQQPQQPLPQANTGTQHVTGISNAPQAKQQQDEGPLSQQVPRGLEGAGKAQLQHEPGQVANPQQWLQPDKLAELLRDPQQLQQVLAQNPALAPLLQQKLQELLAARGGNPTE